MTEWVCGTTESADRDHKLSRKNSIEEMYNSFRFTFIDIAMLFFFGGVGQRIHLFIHTLIHSVRNTHVFVVNVI